MKKETLNLALAVLCGALLGAALTLVVGRGGSGKLASPSGPEVENYIPIIQQDGGYFSRKGIYTTSTLQADDLTSLTGTTTITASYDGFAAWDDFTIATGSAKMVYTNTHGPMFCNGASGMVYAKNNGSFSPSLTFGVGTSTTATVAAVNNLMASTTMATSTTVLMPTYTSTFILGSGESIVGAIYDGTKNIASSTYFGNVSAEFSIGCRLIGA